MHRNTEFCEFRADNMVSDKYCVHISKQLNLIAPASRVATIIMTIFAVIEYRKEKGIGAIRLLEGPDDGVNIGEPQRTANNTA
jgi:hypothetical protein